MLGRNIDDHFNKTPTPHFPRSRFDMGIHKRLQTQAHGRLYPFFVRMVYPGDTWQMQMNAFVRMDTSLRVPLDDVYLDTYWFFCPLRILDENFAKILGEGEPSDYDDVSYGFPQLDITDDAEIDIDCLLSYMGWSTDSALYNSSTHLIYLQNCTGSEEVTPYAFAAYYKVYNDWFRDENLDPSIPYKDLYNNDLYTACYNNPEFDNFRALKVNRYHDYFSSGSIAPQKGPAVTIPLGTSAPVGFVATDTGTMSGNAGSGFIAGSSFEADKFYQLEMTGSQTGVTGENVFTDLSKAAGTINELRLSFAVQALYERRGRYGTRYIEVIRGQWGIEVPDSFFLRPEYLGGSRTPLNNVPVLSTENSSSLGNMAGNSSTLTGGDSFTKTFVEYGILLGVACTRVKHSYTQGKRKELFMLKTQLDLYNPVFANIGLQPIYMEELWNSPDAYDQKEVVFNYQEAWADLRSDFDTFAGKFSVLSDDTDIQNHWHYGDYYSSMPSFSKEWLKEPQENVARTLTGRLITNAASTEIPSHQFMFGFYYHPIVTRILPSHSVPVELIGRL